MLHLISSDADKLTALKQKRAGLAAALVAIEADTPKIQAELGEATFEAENANNTAAEKRRDKAAARFRDAFERRTGLQGAVATCEAKIAALESKISQDEQNDRWEALAAQTRIRDDMASKVKAAIQQLGENLKTLYAANQEINRLAHPGPGLPAFEINEDGGLLRDKALETLVLACLAKEAGLHGVANAPFGISQLPDFDTKLLEASAYVRRCQQQPTQRAA